MRSETRSKSSTVYLRNTKTFGPHPFTRPIYRRAIAQNGQVIKSQVTGQSQSQRVNKISQMTVVGPEHVLKRSRFHIAERHCSWSKTSYAKAMKIESERFDITGPRWYKSQEACKRRYSFPMPLPGWGAIFMQCMYASLISCTYEVQI
jgi:hypothetical protein